MKNRRLACAAALLIAGPAFAQSIEVGELDAAQDFSVGVMDVASGGLDANAWQNTSAVQAARLVGALPERFADPVAQDLALAALLSSGVPPEGDAQAQAAYVRARTDYLLATGRGDRAAALSERDLGLGRDRTFQTDLALDAGRVTEACQTASGVQSGAAEPYWAKLRAFCFAEDGNVAAAELTLDLLAESGHEDAVYFDLMDKRVRGAKVGKVTPNTPLHRAVARAAGLQTRGGAESELDSLLTRMESADIQTLLPAMTVYAAGDGSAYGFDDLRDDDTDVATARLYVLSVERGDARAAGEWLSRMRAKGRLAAAASHMAPILQTLPSADAAAGGLDVMVQAAVLRNDLGSLVGFYQALDASTEDADRVALISDALGGGFRFTPVGEDIESRLGGAKNQAALRDAMIAVALGAQLSGEGRAALEDARFGKLAVPEGKLLALESAARAGARAEVALRAAEILAPGKLDMRTLARTIAALDAAGLAGFAQRAAAYDLASRL